MNPKRNRKHAADDQVVDAVRVGIEPVDRVRRGGQHVVTQRKCLEVRQ